MTEKFRNPVLESGADPFVVLFEDRYYYVYSANGGVYVSSADNIHRLNKDGNLVYMPPEGTMYSKEYWAPEIHNIGGEWYLYVAADDGINANHRMYVLKSKNGRPDGEYEMLGKVTDPTDKWAIDGTVIDKDGELYFVWSGWENSRDDNAQNIYIAKMSSPTEIAGERVMLSTPEYEWEKRGSGPLKDGRVLPVVNEGPQILCKDGTVHIVYSASGSWCRHYCLGILTYRGGDIMDPKNWTKGTKAVFSENEGTYGTGHCSFVKALDGTDFIIYHAMRIPNGNWKDRGVRAQPFTWNGDMPVFGKAATPEDEIEIAIGRGV